MKKRSARVVVISGSTSGIGKALAEMYRQSGDTVIGMARTAVGDDIAVDVTDTEALIRAVDGVGQKYGRIDTVIACAGAGLSGATELLPTEDIERQIDLNFTGAVTLAQAALKYMEKGGHVAFISSACALFALPYRAMYCASKAAVNMAAYGLYMELKSFGIKVSTICPGDIKTEFTRNRVKRSGGGRYGDAPERAAQKIDSREHKRMELDRAAKKIYKHCNKCGKPLYIVGAKYRVLNFLRHVLPQKLFLNVTAKIFG
ncbi:MAG: SDR family NAD(P)-dependent oxidoreductase [Roseburia sp.]|nr:SDR family NAD(P)-dependent oxidoreductase [Roseburia sp.]